MKKNLFKKGTILIEMILALAIGSVILAVVSNVLAVSQQTNLRSYQNQQANLYLLEAEAAVKSLWLDDWQNINVNDFYHPLINGANWSLINGEETLGIFKRKIKIEDALRDSNNNISSTGTVDPDTKKITITVSWDTPLKTNLSQMFYLTHFKNNTDLKQ